MFVCMNRASLIFTLLLSLLLTSCQDYPSVPKEEKIEPEVFSPFSQPLTAEPALFGEGTISTLFSVRDFTLSPEQDEFFFTLETPGSKFGVILHSKKVEKGWSQPKVAPFSGHYRDLEPAFSPDGKEVFFCSKRPLTYDSTSTDYNLWKVSRTENGWGEPEDLGLEINRKGNEFYPSVNKFGDVFFTASQDGPGGMEDIFVSRLTSVGYAPRLRLPDEINTEGYEYNAFIDPEEKYLIFGSYGREDGQGGGDLYISYKIGTGKWSPAQNLGVPINSPFMDYCPFISPDGSTLYFTSSRNSLQEHYPEGITFSDLTQILNSPLNGSTNIYRMKWTPPARE